MVCREAIKKLKAKKKAREEGYNREREIFEYINNKICPECGGFILMKRANLFRQYDLFECTSCGFVHMEY